jgi:hypothetical protein
LDATKRGCRVEGGLQKCKVFVRTYGLTGIGAAAAL